MYLSRLIVKNYRSIRGLDLKFEQGKNIIVGRNNAGKSNIVKAVDLLLGESSPTWNKSENVTDNDFYSGNTDNSIFIWCELNRNKDAGDNLEPLDFSDIANSAVARIVQGDRRNPDRYSIQVNDFSDDEIEKIFEFYTEEGDAKLSDNNSDFNKYWVGGKSYCKTNFADEFQDVVKVAFAFSAEKVEGKLVKLLAFLYTTNGTDWNVALGGGNIRSVFIQSAIIPAFRDPKDQLRITNWTWYGKLLKEYIPSDDPELKSAFEQVKNASNSVFQKLQDAVCNKNIDVTFPNTKLTFQFNPDTKQDIHKSTLIYVDDGFNSELKDKGSGIQSAVIIGLFDFYIREVARTKSSILVIEEPELYLHPHGRRVISDRLNHFLDNGNNQVIATTHSSEFITAAAENLNIIVAHKNKETRAKNIRFDSAKRKQILIRKQNAEMFFADAVILTEDLKYFLEVAAKDYGGNKVIEQPDKTLGENWLNSYNVSILNCGGKTEFWKYVEVLRELDIPAFVVADFDFLCDGISEYMTKLNEPREKIDRLNSVKSGLPASCRALSNITEDAKKNEVTAFLKELEQEKIYLLPGKLEDLYKIKPATSKEQGVLETIGAMIDQNEGLSKFVSDTDFKKFFDLFVAECITAKPSTPSEQEPEQGEINEEEEIDMEGIPF